MSSSKSDSTTRVDNWLTLADATGIVFPRQTGEHWFTPVVDFYLIAGIGLADTILRRFHDQGKP